MKRIKKYAVFLSLLLVVTSELKAQEITGDTIYVDEKNFVGVRFPSLPTNFYTNPSDAPYNIATLKKGFTIIAKKKNAPPADLKVTVGDYTIKFILFYKRIAENGIITDYDYDTKDKLKKKIKRWKEIDNKYDETIANADKLYNEGNYEQAKELYTIALGISNKPWPKEQIKKINKELKKVKRKKN